MAGAPRFRTESDGQLAFDARQGFSLKIDLIEIQHAGYIERIYVREPFGKGSLASKSDLLLLRAVTVVGRGDDGDVLDFQWLLSEVAKTGAFPLVDGGELDLLCKAVETCLGAVGRFVVAAILGSANAAAAERLMSL